MQRLLDALTNDAPEGQSHSPTCGSLALTAAFGDKLDLHHMLALKARPDGKEPHLMVKSVHKLFRLTQTRIQVDHMIDKRNDLFFEHIADVETGEVKKQFEKTLSYFRGHCSAKKTQGDL